MDDEPRGLLDHQQVLVLGDDVERLVGWLKGRGLVRKLELELLAALEPMALRPSLAVHEHCTFAHEALVRSAATNERNSRPTPTTMNVSARLKAGQ
jgi:hypothetical protein